ncbi:MULTISPECIES: hypothetical protein [Anaerolinea]|jgi:hypothetical protein|uniref:hypothetical protein n=1 Tax=Anaerolinea TaxID=233189 RepID=UPI002603FF0E|nr:hypothetical protein [Anaerolinea thermophila]
MNTLKPAFSLEINLIRVFLVLASLLGFASQTVFWTIVAVVMDGLVLLSLYADLIWVDVLPDGLRLRRWIGKENSMSWDEVEEIQFNDLEIRLVGKGRKHRLTFPTQMRGLDVLLRDLLKRFPAAMWRPASMTQPVRLEGYTLIFSEGMSRQRHPLTAVRGLDLQEEYSFWSGVKFRSRVRLSGNQERTFNGIQVFILLFNWMRRETTA